MFNDNSRGRLFNYFWLVNNCSDKSTDCEFTNISNPSNKYWTDDSWCNDEENCSGRQKAPLCATNENSSWEEEQQLVRNLFVGSNILGNFSANSEKGISLCKKLLNSLDQKTLTPKIIQRRQPKHLKHFQTGTSVEYHHDMTNRWTDIEISTSDRPGLLASICQVFLKHETVIKKARIATY